MKPTAPRWRVLAASAAVALLVVLAIRGWLHVSKRASAGPPSPFPPGLWNPAPRGAGTPPAAAAREELTAIPYLQGYDPAPAQAGVTRHDPGRAFPGLNLYISGHAPEAFLVDMQGEVLHRWRKPARSIWPDADPKALGSLYWRRVHALDDGGLLAIYDGLGLVRLDAGSGVRWAHRGTAHHDLFVQPDGTVAVLTQQSRVIPEVHPTLLSVEDFVTVLDAQGRPLRRVSLYAAFRDSPYAPSLARLPPGGDIFHTNTLTILDGSLAQRWPLLARGRALVSMRTTDTVAIVDLDAQRVVWALSGLFRAQHEPSLTPEGQLLLFDNRGRAGRSQALELDPWTQQLAWRYPGDGAGEDLISWTSGSAQRLPNGNTLITESTSGRALEVTRAGEVVWEFWNPHRAGEQQQMVATLLEVVRLDAGFAARVGLSRRVGATTAAPGR